MPVESLFAIGPRMLGRYELLAPIARGGMGQVWAGRLRGARGFNKLVAIKTLLPLPDPEGRLEAMLFEEARIASLIHHANVVQTLELGEHEGELYLVMEWVDGESLDYIMHRAEARGGVPIAIAAHWMGQTLLGLHAAHELTGDQGAPLGVVHRDVSPHNVLVTYTGTAKLVDFGIAKAMNQSTTFSGEIKGKLSYIAPEQVLCEVIDRRADIFSLGILLYLLTTGRHPFKRAGSEAILPGITSDEPPTPPSQLVNGYPPLLEELVLKALRKAPVERWETAERMYAALQRAVPEAFETGFEARVKDFLNVLVSDRAGARRESLRRAQLEADARASNDANAGPSLGSLRAVSVERSQGPFPRPEAPAPFAPSRRPLRIVPWAGLGIVLLALGAVLALGARGSDGRASAAPPTTLESPLAVPSHDGAARPTSGPRVEPVPHDSPEMPTLEEETERSTDVTPSPGADRPTSTATRPARRQPRRNTGRNASADLIKPDYAR